MHSQLATRSPIPGTRTPSSKRGRNRKVIPAQELACMFRPLSGHRLLSAQCQKPDPTREQLFIHKGRSSATTSTGWLDARPAGTAATSCRADGSPPEQGPSRLPLSTPIDRPALGNPHYGWPPATVIFINMYMSVDIRPTEGEARTQLQLRVALPCPRAALTGELDRWY